MRSFTPSLIKPGGLASADVDTEGKPPEIVSAAGLASKAASNCAAHEFSVNHSPTGFAYMATAFHNANVAAMGMHMEGDDASAARLVRLTRTNEARYLSLARHARDANAQQILDSVSAETDKLAGRF